MIHIAIVEDSPSDAKQMRDFIEHWKDAEGEDVVISEYHCACDILTEFSGQYDIIFMDIMLPDKSGMDAAKSIRSMDSSVLLVFTTSMKQYAINGYEVEALDFVLKPIHYSRFERLMKKCMNRLSRKAEHVVLRVPGTTYSIEVDDIAYAESSGHSVIFHLLNGQSIQKRMTLGETEEQLPAAQFARCGVSFLVNLKYVRYIEGEYVTVNDTKLKITRSKSREFRKAFVEFYSK